MASKGDKGDKPINGQDYNTDEDKETIKNIIVENAKPDIDEYVAEQKKVLEDKEKEIVSELENEKSILIDEIVDSQSGFDNNAKTKTAKFNENVEFQTKVASNIIDEKISRITEENIDIDPNAEIIDARAGFTNLGQNLKQKPFCFDSIDKMKSCIYLTNGNFIIIDDLSNGNFLFKVSSTETGLLLDNGLNAVPLVCNFNIFPNDEFISLLPNNFTFKTKGFYSIDDGFGCTYYVTKTWTSNSLHIGNYYIYPLSQNKGELFLPYYGIRTGENYMNSNSTVLENIEYISFGSLLIFPSGHFYFNKPIILSRQNSIKGAGCSYTSDYNTSGLTWLHFLNLKENEAAIETQTGSISDLIICGNPEIYNLSIDRNKTVISPDEIVKETYVYKTLGIRHNNMGLLSLNNVSFMYFYYGAWIHTGNIKISNIYSRHCHYGLSVGNDTRIHSVFGFEVMVLLEIRGSITSASQIRGDSIGKHLIVIGSGEKDYNGEYPGGTTSSVYLYDLDADYCLGSILHLGITDEHWEVISGLNVYGVRGRSCVYKAYDYINGTPPTPNDIINDSDIEYFPLISVNSKTHVFGGIIFTTQPIYENDRINPLDTESNYSLPKFLICCKTDSNVNGLKIYDSREGINRENFSKKFIDNRVKSLSINVKNLIFTLENSQETLYYLRSGNNVKYQLSATKIDLLE